MAEQRDLSLRAISVFAAALAATIVLVLVVSRLLLAALEQRHAAAQLPPAPLTGPSAGPPPPRLQVHAPAELREWRAQQAMQLNSYGWVDRDQGVVHIPITQAMQLLAERGLPAAKQKGNAP